MCIFTYFWGVWNSVWSLGEKKNVMYDYLGNENRKFCPRAPMYSGGQRQGHASHYYQALKGVTNTNRNRGSGGDRGGARAQATTDRTALLLRRANLHIAGRTNARAGA